MLALAARGCMHDLVFARGRSVHILEFTLFISTSKTPNSLVACQADNSSRFFSQSSYLLYVHFPSDAVVNTPVIYLHRQVTTLVETPKLRIWWIGSFSECLLWGRLMRCPLRPQFCEDNHQCMKAVSRAKCSQCTLLVG